MKVSYKWLSEYFEKKLPEPKVLADLFTVHVFEVEEIEQKGDDTIFDFKILPDRAHYLLSHKGVAREASVLTDNTIKVRKKSEIKTEGKDIGLKIENSDLCRRYIAREMENIAVTASPEWLRIKLENVGQRSINNLVDASNYVMLDVGQPLHVFDADKISGRIVVRNAKKDEKIVLLTGQELILSEEDLVIADNDGALAIAGVKGGKRAEVTDVTKRIIIESANFDPTTVRKTSTRLNLRNDSSKRFENEITPALAAEAMGEITNIILDLSKDAKILGTKDVYPNPVKTWSVTVDPKNVAVIIGTEVSEQKIESILKKMDCEIEKEGEMMKVTPPLDRLDIKIPEDVSDEVGRVLGYEMLPPAMPPKLSESLLPDRTFFYCEKIKNLLIERDYSETLLYSLVAKGHHEIVYPLASDKSALREKLSTKISEALMVNGRNADLLSLETIKIFEIGKVFQKEGEKAVLGLGVLQIKKIKGITSEKLIKEDISSLEKGLGVSLKAEIKNGEFGAIAEIDLDAVIAQLPLQGKISELGFESLPRNKKYQKFSLYPFIVRDLAVFVPENTEESEIHEIIKENAGELCIKSWLFDVFTKETPEGKRKSFAFRLIFQSFEKTLEDTEVNKVMDRVYSAISQNKNWQIR